MSFFLHHLFTKNQTCPWSLKAGSKAQKLTARWPWSQVSGMKCLWNVAFPCHRTIAGYWWAYLELHTTGTTFLPLTSTAAALLPGGASSGVCFPKTFLTQSAFTFPINLSQEAGFVWNQVGVGSLANINSVKSRLQYAVSLAFRVRIRPSRTDSSARKSQLQKLSSFLLMQKADLYNSWFRPRIKHNEVPELSVGSLKHFPFWPV